MPREPLTRVVALALIAVTGLLYVRFAPGAGPVVVPEGARSGELILEPADVEPLLGACSWNG